LLASGDHRNTYRDQQTTRGCTRNVKTQTYEHNFIGQPPYYTLKNDDDNNFDLKQPKTSENSNIQKKTVSESPRTNLQCHKHTQTSHSPHPASQLKRQSKLRLKNPQRFSDENELVIDNIDSIVNGRSDNALNNSKDMADVDITEKQSGIIKDVANSEYLHKKEKLDELNTKEIVDEVYESVDFQTPPENMRILYRSKDCFGDDCTDVNELLIKHEPKMPKDWSPSRTSVCGESVELDAQDCSSQLYKSVQLSREFNEDVKITEDYSTTSTDRLAGELTRNSNEPDPCIEEVEDLIEDDTENYDFVDFADVNNSDAFVSSNHALFEEFTKQKTFVRESKIVVNSGDNEETKTIKESNKFAKHDFVDSGDDDDNGNRFIRQNTFVRESKIIVISDEALDEEKKETKCCEIDGDEIDNFSSSRKMTFQKESKIIMNPGDNHIDEETEATTKDGSSNNEERFTKQKTLLRESEIRVNPEDETCSSNETTTSQDFEIVKVLPDFDYSSPSCSDKQSEKTTRRRKRTIVKESKIKRMKSSEDMQVNYQGREILIDIDQDCDVLARGENKGCDTLEPQQLSNFESIIPGGQIINYKTKSLNVNIFNWGDNAIDSGDITVNGNMDLIIDQNKLLYSDKSNSAMTSQAPQNADKASTREMLSSNSNNINQQNLFRFSNHDKHHVKEENSRSQLDVGGFQSFVPEASPVAITNNSTNSQNPTCNEEILLSSIDTCLEQQHQQQLRSESRLSSDEESRYFTQEKDDLSSNDSGKLVLYLYSIIYAHIRHI